MINYFPHTHITKVQLTISFQTWTRKKTHSLVGTAWLLSLLFSVPQMHIFGYRKLPSVPGSYDCWAVWDFQWSIPVSII